MTTLEGPFVGKNGRLVWREYRETARTLLPVAYLEKGNPELPCGEPPGAVVQSVLSLFSRRKSCDYRRLVTALAREAAQTGFNPEDLVENLVSARWLDKQVKLGRDGISEVETKLVPGDRLVKALAEQSEQKLNKARRWSAELAGLLEQLAASEAPEETQRVAIQKITSLCRGFVDKINNYLEHGGPEPEIKWSGGTWRFNPGRLPNNFTLAVEFLLAMGLSITRNPNGFDWKEIGASIWPEIGASKRFDRLRRELPGFFEEVTGISPGDAGLVSQGSLYSVYLAGEYSVTCRGGVFTGVPGAPVSALTNIQLEEAGAIGSGAGRVILTENRALLLKMHKTGWLARNPGLLVIGLDGRLRRAHRRMLEELKKQKPRSYFAWVDTDTAGQSIAASVAEILPGCLFVLPPGKLYPYKDWLSLLRENKALAGKEQEEYLGEQETWDRLFKL